MAAASRSTRARWASRWVLLGGPPDRPRFIGPRRVSARWLLRRSSRSVTGSPNRSATASAHARVKAACGPSAPDASSGSPTTRASIPSASTIARRAASSSSSDRRRRIVASGRATDPSSSPTASPTRRSPRSIRAGGSRPAEPDGAGVSIGTAPETVRSTRLSKLGSSPTNPARRLISDVPNGSRIACASAIDLPRMSFFRCSGSRTATCWAEAVTGTLTVWPTTSGSPTSIRTEPGTSW